MDEHLEKTTQEVGGRFNLLQAVYRGQVTLLVEAEQLIDVCRLLRDEHHFEMLAGLTAVDYWPEMEPRFHVVYMLRSLKYNTRILLRMPVPGQQPSVPSIVELWPNADWHEREVWDMFGIHFKNHPSLRRILMPYDWEGHPLRKDYPLGYEEVRFTFNAEDLNVRKPFPRK